MRFTSFIVAGLFAVAASAQSSTATTTAASTSVSIDPAQSSVASQIEQCLSKCSADDTACRAHCIAVPSPDTQNVNATTSCVADCPQGNGTAADNQAYANCVQGCIGQYYFTSTGTPNLATSGAGNSGSSVTQVATTITSGGSTFVTSVPVTSASSASGSSSPSETPKSGAAAFAPVGTGMALFGLLAGFIAL